MSDLQSDQAQQAQDAPAVSGQSQILWRDYAPTKAEHDALEAFAASLTSEQHEACDAYLKSVGDKPAYAFAQLLAELKDKFPANVPSPTPPPVPTPESPSADAPAVEASAPSAAVAPDAPAAGA